MSRRRRLWAAALVAACSLAPGPSRAEGLTEAQRVRLTHDLDLRRSERHMSSQVFDVAAVVDAVDRRLEAGAPREDLDAIVAEVLDEVLISFAPRGATPKPGFKYRYPMDVSTPVLVSQGPNTEPTHQDLEAYDFAIPIGTPVLAARPGRVALVVDGFELEDLPPGQGWMVNQVDVLHRDGTWATYLHLNAGIPVREGQEVRGGERIGYSGNTGFSKDPHLHFQVQARGADGKPRTVPVRFRDGTKEGARPRTLSFVLGRRPSNVGLRASVGGAPVAEGAVLPGELGGAKRLRVELRTPGGRWVDVTGDERTRFVSATPWLAQVSPQGRVRFVRNRRWRGTLFTTSARVVVTAVFDDPGMKALGYVDVLWNLHAPQLEAQGDGS